MSVFGSGSAPVHTNGTRVFHAGGASTKAEVATGQARATLGPFRPEWMDTREDLPCKRHPANWWFAPEENEHGDLISTREDMQKAQALCKTCPMQLECREFGLQNANNGIWGATRVDNLKAATRRDLLLSVQRQLRRAS